MDTTLWLLIVVSALLVLNIFMLHSRVRMLEKTVATMTDIILDDAE